MEQFDKSASHSLESETIHDKSATERLARQTKSSIEDVPIIDMAAFLDDEGSDRAK
jgi:hypothetical protein